MNITLPPLPDVEYNLGSEFERSDAYSDLDMLAYGRDAVMADRASRVPMPDEQLGLLLLDNYSECPVETIFALGRALEAHHGIGAKP